jgi:hypothetical protein
MNNASKTIRGRTSALGESWQGGAAAARTARNARVGFHQRAAGHKWRNMGGPFGAIPAAGRGLKAFQKNPLLQKYMMAEIPYSITTGNSLLSSLPYGNEIGTAVQTAAMPIFSAGAMGVNAFMNKKINDPEYQDAAREAGTAGSNRGSVDAMQALQHNPNLLTADPGTYLSRMQEYQTEVGFPQIAEAMQRYRDNKDPRPSSWFQRKGAFLGLGNTPMPELIRNEIRGYALDNFAKQLGHE